MNALIALLHFCEVHGPCVVYCTQTIHNSTTPTPTPAPASAAEDIAMTIPALRSMTMAAPIPINKPKLQPSTHQLSTTPSSASFRSLNTTTPKSSSCAACTAQLPLMTSTTGAVIEAKRLVTVDQDDPTVQYMGTTKAPQQPHLYKAVRLACVRSLTAEFCQGRDGPVLFGDDENGYVMSYMFKLRDSQARGEARFYSLMMLMTDRVYLVSCWPFLVR
jgi:hypothetical protein